MARINPKLGEQSIFAFNKTIKGTLTVDGNVTVNITDLQIVFSSSGVLTGDAGLTFNSTTDVFTLGTNHIYSQGAHGLTLDADDFAVGSGATSYAWWDDSVQQLKLVGLETTTASQLTLAGSDNNNYPAIYMGRTTDSDEFSILHAGYWRIGTSTTVNMRLVSNLLQGITIGTAGQVNVGTTTLGAAQGDFAAGLTGEAQTWYDQSAATQYWYNASGTVSNQISAVAGTNTVFNETGLDIDHRWEAVGQANLAVYDAGLAAIGFGTTASSDRLLNILRSWTVTSGTRYGAVLSSQSTGLAGDSTATLVAMQYDAVHSTAFNLSRIIGSVSTARDTAGFSGGTLSFLEGSRVDSIHIGAGAVTTAYGIRVIQTVTGAGVASEWNQCLLTDLTGGTVTTRIGFRQQGTNAHNRFQGNTTFGADAAPATSAAVDISSTTGALLVPRMTTTQRDALTAANGMIIYDSTLNQMQGYINGAWTAM